MLHAALDRAEAVTVYPTTRVYGGVAVQKEFLTGKQLVVVWFGIRHCLGVLELASTTFEVSGVHRFAWSAQHVCALAHMHPKRKVMFHRNSQHVPPGSVKFKLPHYLSSTMTLGSSPSDMEPPSSTKL